MKPFSACAITTLRNDRIFLKKWVSYYGKELGYENLYIVFDGQDQLVPEDLGPVSILRLPHIPAERAKGDKIRAAFMSKLAAGLLQKYAMVIATDVDEFILVDPRSSTSLKEYLSQTNGAVISALGLDVAQNLDTEEAIDLDRPFLKQRKYAHVNSRYTKASIITKALAWGSGMHRVKGRNFKIDPNLYLFHFGMVDYQNSIGITGDQERIKNNWNRHSERRLEVFDIIRQNQALDADANFQSARRRQSLCRPVYAWNKPGKAQKNLVLLIPDRFAHLV